MDIVNALMFRALLLFLALGSIAGLMVGAALILRPDKLLRLNKYANRWVSTRKLNQSLERPIAVDHLFYRYRHAGSVFVLAGAVFILYYFTVTFDKPDILANLSRNTTVSPLLIEWLLDALVLAGMIGAVFALIIGLFLLFRPSLLRKFETGANQSASLRRALKPFEVPRSGLDEYVFRNVQLAGVLLLFGSLYTLVGLTAWISHFN